MSAKPRLPPKRLRCAIYTRKSSDEGLDQAFNSLDAQREAGEAYVKSQTAEGWRPIATRYDDGGFSGGSMERPALLRLLADVDAGLIDVVVVYKIDRLTRSLADFARIVERFDARGISFVSVTQAFNTTSSMGRLTLNVLLSFAQFEREVTGERIRDKIAASKAKGLWMGGLPPLGYDLPAPGSRVLQVNPAEAVTVRHIFARYLELASVHRLAQDLAEHGITSKHRCTADGRASGGQPFSRGALFHLLRNRLYLGHIPHKDLVHDGQHEAIVDPALFDRVQTLLTSQVRRRGSPAQPSLACARLTGRIFDADGHPMSPTHARGKTGKLYRYYVSASLQRGIGGKSGAGLQRISAPALEDLVQTTLARLLPTQADPLRPLLRTTVRHRQLVLTLRGASRAMTDQLRPEESLIRDADDPKLWHLALPIALSRTGGKTAITSGAPNRARLDPAMIAALRRAHAMVGRDAHGPILTAAPDSQYARRLAGLALLAPDIQRDLLAGCQPPHLTLARLMAVEAPLDWAEQRRIFGFAAVSMA
jgi:DNA invertase Pin-like site-specific DNA recombinase